MLLYSQKLGPSKKVHWIFVAFLLLHTACAGCKQHGLGLHPKEFGLTLAFAPSNPAQTIGTINGRPVIALSAQVKALGNVPDDKTFVGAIFIPETGGAKDAALLQTAITTIQEEGKSLSSKGKGIKPNSMQVLEEGLVICYENLQANVAQKKAINFAVSFIKQEGLRPKTKYKVYMFAVYPDDTHPWVFTTKECTYTTPDFIASVPVTMTVASCQEEVVGPDLKVRFKFEGAMPTPPTTGQACFLLVKENTGGPAGGLEKLLMAGQALPAPISDLARNFQLVDASNKDVIAYPLTFPLATPFPTVDNLDTDGVVSKSVRYEVYLAHQDGTHFSVSTDTKIIAMLEAKAEPGLKSSPRIVSQEFDRTKIDPTLKHLELSFMGSVCDQENTNNPKLCFVFWKTTIAAPRKEDITDAVKAADKLKINQFQKVPPDTGTDSPDTGTKFIIYLANDSITANQKAAIDITKANANASGLFDCGGTYEACAALVDADFKGSILLGSGPLQTQTLVIPDLKARPKLESLAVTELIADASGSDPITNVLNLSFCCSVDLQENTQDAKLCVVFYPNHIRLDQANMKAAVQAADKQLADKFQTVDVSGNNCIIYLSNELILVNGDTKNFDIDAKDARFSLGTTYIARAALVDNAFQGAVLLGTGALDTKELKLSCVSNFLNKTTYKKEGDKYKFDCTIDADMLNINNFHVGFGNQKFEGEIMNAVRSMSNDSFLNHTTHYIFERKIGTDFLQNTKYRIFPVIGIEDPVIKTEYKERFYGRRSIINIGKKETNAPTCVTQIVKYQENSYTIEFCKHEDNPEVNAQNGKVCAWIVDTESRSKNLLNLSVPIEKEVLRKALAKHYQENGEPDTSVWEYYGIDENIEVDELEEEEE